MDAVFVDDWERVGRDVEDVWDANDRREHGAAWHAGKEHEMKTHQRLQAWALASLLFTTGPAGAQSPATRTAFPDHPVLPPDIEIELALNAAPAHLRDGATVFVFGSTGYVKAKEGTNAFTCVVSRRGGDVFPVCWDAEGAKALLPIDLDEAKLRLAGMSIAEIDREVADGFKNGKYRAPSRTGVAYMLSPMRYRIDEHGTVTPANPNPHVMFYGPGLTDADIGGVRGSLVFMNKVGPDGMIIVPVGSKERETILNQSRLLIDRVEQALGTREPRSRRDQGDRVAERMFSSPATRPIAPSSCVLLGTRPGFYLPSFSGGRHTAFKRSKRRRFGRTHLTGRVDARARACRSKQQHGGQAACKPLKSRTCSEWEPKAHSDRSISAGMMS